MAAVAMPPIDLHGTARSHSRGTGGISPSSARSQPGGAHAGFQHLTFDSARGLGEKSGDRERLRNKLVDVGERFIGFDKVLEDDTMKRKMLEVKKFQAAQDGVAKLEKAMNTEVRKRVDTNKQVQEMCDSMANDMLERLQTGVLIRIEKLSSSIESLLLRCSNLEKGIAQFRGQLPSKLQVDTAALVKEISELRNQMELDRKDRVSRDTALLRRLAEMEALEAGQFNDGSKQLAETYASCKEEINVLARSEEASDGKTEKFRAFILEEIAGMKNTLAVATQARHQTDDDIVQAMNQYTNALHKGLSTANNR